MWLLFVSGRRDIEINDGFRYSAVTLPVRAVFCIYRIFSLISVFFRRLYVDVRSSDVAMNLVFFVYFTILVKFQD